VKKRLKELCLADQSLSTDYEYIVRKERHSRCRHLRGDDDGSTAYHDLDLLEAAKLPLTLWFLAMHLLTQAKNNISALELKRHFGVVSDTRRCWSG
jgi:hypothetical protein